MARKQAEQEDRLSALPDPILVHILSFLPTDEAVRTVLIRRFSTLWTSLPNLDFNDDLLSFIWPSDEDINTNFFRFVHNVLKLHQRPTIDRFRVLIGTMLYGLDITCDQSENWTLEIDSWLAFALRKQVKFLEFGFGMVEPDNEVYKLPFVEFVSASVVELKFVYIEITLQKQVKMDSLRVLKLEYVTLNDDVFKEIIRGCPLLKELEISNCWDLTEINSPTLDVLKLGREIIASSEEIMRINCPNLSSFNYSGCVDGLEIVNLSSLADYSFSLSYKCYSDGITTTKFKEYTEFESILIKLLHAKIVSLSHDVATVLFYCMLIRHLQILIHWRRVDLGIWLTDKQILGVCHLLETSPYLEELIINVPSWVSDSNQSLESELESCNLGKEEEYCWSSLKNIVIHNISMSMYPVAIRLVEILLKSSPVLDKLVIYYKASDGSSETQVCLMTSEQLEEFSKKLPTFTKASPTTKVLLF